MFGMKKEPALDRRRSLAGIPVVNPGVTSEEIEAGRLRLTARFPRGTGLLARFQPPVLERSVKLDELGAFVFRLIDGRRSVLEIVDLFAARYRANRREAELSVAAFVRSLAERRMISVVIE
jgi:hypothetical protein